MKMSRSILAVLAVAMLVLGLAACKSTTTDQSSASTAVSMPNGPTTAAPDFNTAVESPDAAGRKAQMVQQAPTDNTPSSYAGSGQALVKPVPAQTTTTVVTTYPASTLKTTTVTTAPDTTAVAEIAPPPAPAVVEIAPPPAPAVVETTTTTTTVDNTPMTSAAQEDTTATTETKTTTTHKRMRKD